MKKSTIRDLELVGIAALCLLYTLSGCTRALRGPVEDHAVQAAVIAHECRNTGILGEGKCTQEDLDAMAEQAKLISDIVKRRKPEERK